MLTRNVIEDIEVCTLTHTSNKDHSLPLETALKNKIKNLQFKCVFVVTTKGDNIYRKYSLLLSQCIHGWKLLTCCYFGYILWVSNCILSCVETAIQNRIMFPKASFCVYRDDVHCSFCYIISHVALMIVAKAKAKAYFYFYSLLFFVVVCYQMNKIFDEQTS